jgi:tetratricopeptide (TPR) repeat protein
MKWLLAVWLLPIVQISASAQQGNVEALLLQGEGYAAEGKLIQAREAYEKAIASGAAVEKDAERSYKLGLWYKNAEPHDFGKAAQWFESALNIKPDDEIRLHLAQAFSWNGQYSSAIEQYSQLVRNKPADAELKRQLARVLSWAKQYPEYKQRFPMTWNSLLNALV